MQNHLLGHAQGSDRAAEVQRLKQHRHVMVLNQNQVLTEPTLMLDPWQSSRVVLKDRVKNSDLDKEGEDDSFWRK